MDSMKDMGISDSERIHLDKMIRVNEAEDHTDQIRELKHSKLIFDDVNTLMKIKKEWGSRATQDVSAYDIECESKCHFLFNKYTDIYNKVKKDEMNMDILLQLINVLHYIEDGAVNQHEGSVMVGKLLKQIYIDGAIKKADKLNVESNEGMDKIDEIREAKNISWKEYKNQRESIEMDLTEILGVD
jgi:hypothetical protein